MKKTALILSLLAEGRVVVISRKQTLYVPHA